MTTHSSRTIHVMFFLLLEGEFNTQILLLTFLVLSAMYYYCFYNLFLIYFDWFLFFDSYQLEALDNALRENTIVYLETGSGKTLIAIMLLRSYAHHLRKPSSSIAVFLVPQVVLVSQVCHFFSGDDDAFCKFEIHYLIVLCCDGSLLLLLSLLYSLPF